MKETKQTKLTNHTELHCICSAYDNGHNEGGKVRLFECVLDGTNKTPCYCVIMPEKTWYDKKSHKIENMLRRYFWRIRHFRWVRKWKDKK
jgi:CTP-dependent riboflavin kinase